MKPFQINPGLILLCIFIANSAVQAQYNEANLRLEPEATTFAYQNLQLYPVRANKAFFDFNKRVGNYITLKDALEKKKVVITEYGKDESDATVNTLFIENVSRDTIMLLAGEVVQGGKQDRMIAGDYLLYPKSGKKDVSVFCVEHGRWQPDKGSMEFNGYFTISSNEVRKAAVVGKDQQMVWEEVAENTEKNKAESGTGSLTALRKSGDYTKELKGYSDKLGEAFRKDPNVIGVIAVSGDKILGCDMFATHELFEKSFPNLLNSYAAEAITSGAPVSISYEKVKTYLSGIISDERNQDRKIEEKGNQLKEGGRKIHISTFE